MYKYTLVDTYNRVELKDISKESYQVAEQFYEQYKLFESVIGAYKNCKFALRDYTLFYENITSNNTNIDLNIIHDEGVYLLTSNIILLRVFIDNVKKYISLSNLILRNFWFNWVSVHS